MTDISKIQTYQSRLDHSLLSRERARSSEDDHHMEFVDEVNGIAYIDDARSVTPAATRNSLAAIATSVVLITGSKNAECDFSLISSQVREKVVAVIYLGTDSDQILRHYSSHSMLFASAVNTREAVTMAACFAQSGDVVLFSTSCASDAADNYKIRGNEFKEAVKGLRK